MKNILLVDEHSFVLEAYENLLKNTTAFQIENLFKATSIEKAISIMNEEEQIDIAFFGINMPKNNVLKIEDGIDLAQYFKSKHPFAKIAFITMHSEFCVLLKAINFIKPNVFISKTDVDAFTFSSIFKALKNDEHFYSKEMLEVYKWTKQSQIKLDMYDFQILTQTNKGVKTKELTNYLPLSLSAIEKRKSNLKLIISDFKWVSIKK